MFLKEKTSGRTWSLDPERIYRLGRGSDQDIQLDEASVSRSHAELVWNGEAWQIKDCNSRFGIFVCDRKCETQAIQIGDTFRLGSHPGITLELEAVAMQRATQRCYFPTAPAKPPFSLENFQGQLAFKESLANSAELILNASLSNPVQGILLLAGPGRGQRFLVRCLSDQLSQERGVSFTFLSRNLQDAKNLAQSHKLIRKWLKQATKKAPAVLLIQNFEQFYQYFDEAVQDKRPSAGKLTWWQKFMTFLGFADFRSEAEKARQIQKQLTADLQKAWQWNVQKTDKVLVVAAANNPENLPETVRQPGQRFSYVLQLNRPDPAGTQAILEK
ncbi:MAG: FHA domain-containing protein [Cyanobacteria bacterium P01_H01_bin.15]